MTDAETLHAQTLRAACAVMSADTCTVMRLVAGLSAQQPWIHVALPVSDLPGISAGGNVSAMEPLETVLWLGDGTADSKLWITNCTFVGDTQPGSMGLRSSGGKFCLTGAGLISSQWPPWHFVKSGEL